VNHRHRKVLHALFGHRTSGNIDVKDVETMLHELGAAVETRSGDCYSGTATLRSTAPRTAWRRTRSCASATS
jgi:hypothetical protein